MEQIDLEIANEIWFSNLQTMMDLDGLEDHENNEGLFLTTPIGEQK